MADDLQQMMERALPCQCGAKLIKQHMCPLHDYGPAVRAALRQAENKGAREMRDECDEVAAEYDDSGHMRMRMQRLPLPHPEQEPDDER